MMSSTISAISAYKGEQLFPMVVSGVNPCRFPTNLTYNLSQKHSNSCVYDFRGTHVSPHNRYSQGETSQSKSVIPSHVFDIHIPPSTTKQPLTPPPPERNGVGESLKPPVERKCAHSPPSYVKSCPTTITSTGNAGSIIFYLAQ